MAIGGIPTEPASALGLPGLDQTGINPENSDILGQITQAFEGLLGDDQPEMEPGAKERRAEEIKEQQSVQYDMGPQERKNIVEYIQKLIDTSESSRSRWMEIRIESNEMMDGVRAPKSDPWPNCSNISVMAVPMHVRLMHSKLVPLIWNENLVHWKAVSMDDIDAIDLVQDFMSWVVHVDLKLGDFVDDLVNALITDGTVAVKIGWETEYRYVRDKESGGFSSRKEVAHQKASVDIIPIDHIHMPYHWVGVDKSEFVAQDVWQRLPDIEALRDRKVYGALTDEGIKHIRDGISDSIKQSLGVIHAHTAGFEPTFAQESSHPIRLVECYMHWRINGEIKDSVFVIEFESGVYLSGKPLTAVNPLGRRPWVIEPFIRRVGRPHGIGLPEAMRGLAKELDAIHNQRIDAGTMGIAPFGFYRAASGLKPEKIQIGPGVMIPVDDTNDVKIAQFQNNLVASFQEERIIIEYIEKLVGASAYQMGRESDIVKSRATATGTMAIIAQGEQTYNLLGMRLQRIVAKVLTKILQMYQCFMPAGYASRIVGDDNKLLFPQGLTPEEIDGGYDAYMTLDTTSGNKSTERQINGLIVDSADKLMLLAQDPRGYKMASEFLRSLGKMDVENYLGPKPQRNANSTAGLLPLGAGSGGASQAPQAVPIAS